MFNLCQKKKSKSPLEDILNQFFYFSQIKFKSFHRQSFISWSFISWQSSKGPKEGHDWYLFAPFYYLHFILLYLVFWTDFQFPHFLVPHIYCIYLMDLPVLCTFIFMSFFPIDFFILGFFSTSEVDLSFFHT